MMTVNEPPWRASSVFNSLDESVPDFGAVLSPEVEFVEPDQIFANSFVNSVSNEKSGYVRCLDVVSSWIGFDNAIVTI